MADQLKDMINSDPASYGNPLDAVVFSRLMDCLAPFEDRPKIAVAVSGGADSMALSLLARDWCRSKGGEMIAITVDHALRSDSAGEAAWVGKQLRMHDIAHRILRWDGAKPQSGVQDAARKARYELLDRELASLGILHLLIAHHNGDQSETIAMRQNRESGVLGRAGMSARRFLRHARVLRPLLPVAKADLVATLRAAGQEWIEDPSNRNANFERVRIRQSAATQTAAQLGAAVSADGKIAQTAESQHRLMAEAAIATLLADAVQIAACGVGRIDFARWHDRQPETDIACYAIGQIVRVVGGSDYMPAFDALAAALTQLGEQSDARISLGGCVLHRRNAVILVYREIGRMDITPKPVDPGHACNPYGQRWDNRFELIFDNDRHAVTADNLDFGRLAIAPLAACDAFHTRAFRAAIGKITPFIDDLPRAALASMPALYDKEALLSVGGLEVSGISDVLSAAGCNMVPIGAGMAIGVRWRFAPPTPLWESGFKSLPNPDALLA
ncbi:tRNA lysidine(34) synthetase TilS [Thalassospira alkalitolerans]|uniref:tRNA lysidine(34) synthetase TilS n=1 Tax=Thalassospira alkalitolerans TaxID=1293890 RepID=UPI000A1E7415|nr:tRNA lysidine(34) synthetase TilS [Thalassospira alkalitolerans]